MEHQLKVGRLIWKTGSLLLLFIFTFSSLGASAPARADTAGANLQVISEYRAAQANPALSDKDKIKAAIDAYFTLRYEGQKVLHAQNFSPLLEDNTQAWVKKEKDKRDIELYIARLFDLKYLSYHYILDYDSIEIKNNTAIISLKESHKVVFEATAPVVSEMANLRHVITLHHKKTGWLVYKDAYRDDSSPELDHMTKADILKKVDENYQSQSQAQSSNSEQTISFPTINSPYVKHTTYNRSAAYTYAESWALWTNSYYPRIVVPPNNPNKSTADCTSFVSQAMYAGMGFSPPDMSGMGSLGDNSQWYFNYNNTNDYSSPWAGVPSQLTFLTRTDTARIGPYGTVSTNKCAVQFGDVVQIIDPKAPGNNTWNHEAIVVHAGNPCNSLSSKLIDAHDNDHKDYPLSNWAGYTLHFILISGWYGN